MVENKQENNIENKQSENSKIVFVDEANDITMLENIDSKDVNNPQCCIEYINDIFHYLKHSETKHLPGPDCLTQQKEVTWNMRNVLFDWLVDVQLKFDLSPETLYLCFNVIDRFLKENDILKNKLQLVGITSLWLASKYEEIYTPDAIDFVDMCAKSYTKKEMIEMEYTILVSLQFSLTIATPVTFLERFLKASNQNISSCVHNNVIHGANYLTEISMLDQNTLKHKYSEICASAIYIARKVLMKESWSKLLIFHTGYTEDDLKECIEHMVNNVSTQKTSKCEAIYKKYCRNKKNQIATFFNKTPLF
jgi:hypothetical protein